MNKPYYILGDNNPFHDYYGNWAMPGSPERRLAEIGESTEQQSAIFSNLIEDLEPLANSIVELSRQLHGL